jgi:chromosome segregation ATPase
MSQAIENVTSFLGRLAERFAGRQQERIASFEDLVRQVADGVSPSENTVLNVLDGVRKTPEDLAAAVQRLLARRRAAAAYEAGKTVDAERAKVLKAAGEAQEVRDRKIRDAEGNFQGAVAPLRAKIDALDRLEKEAKTAAGTLEETFAEVHPEGEAAIQSAARELNAARATAGKARAHAGEVDNQARRAAAALKRLKEGRRLHRGTAELLREAELQESVPKLEEEAAILTADAEAQAAQLLPLERKLAELEAQRYQA